MLKDINISVSNCVLKAAWTSQTTLGYVCASYMPYITKKVWWLQTTTHGYKFWHLLLKYYIQKN